MLNKKAKILVTLFILFGVVIQIVTSLTWMQVSSDILGYGEATIREVYFMSGQAVGELLWMIAIRLFVVKGLLTGELIVEYIICLLILDLVSIIFLSPFQFELSKTASFLVATLGYSYRLKIYIKK